MVRRVAAVSALALIVVFAFVLRSGSSGDLKSLRDGLQQLQEAFNAGEYGFVYDNFLTASCRTEISRKEFIDLYGAPGPREIRVQVGELKNMKIKDDRAEFDLTTVSDDPEPEERTGHLVFVKEEGHWRDTECLGSTKSDQPTPSASPTPPGSGN